MKNSYRLRRLQVNLHEAEAGDNTNGETINILRHKVAECRRNWQRGSGNNFFDNTRTALELKLAFCASVYQV